MTLGDVLSALVEWGWRIVPFEIVQAYEVAVRLRFGRVVGVVGPGFRWRWPLIEELHQYSVVTRIVELDPQTVETAGGEIVTFALSVRYRIIDAIALHTRVYDPYESVREAVRSVAGAEAACLALRQTSSAGRGYKLACSVHEVAAEELEPWGVEVEDIGALTFTVAPTLRLILDRGPRVSEP